MNELQIAKQTAQARANKTGLTHYVTKTYTGNYQVRKGEPGKVVTKDNGCWFFGTFRPTA